MVQINIGEIINSIKKGEDPTIDTIRKKRFFEDDESFQEELAKKILKDPKYKQVVDKLGELTTRRDNLLRQLAKTEIDIDACLVMMGMNIEKEQIDGGMK